MDRFTTFFEQLPLPEVAHLVRRTVYGGIVVGVATLVVSAVLGYPLVGVGGCVGLGLGLGNIRLLTRSVAKLSSRSEAHPRRQVASRTLARLVLTTAIVVGLAFASVQLGFGAAGGIVVFYFLYMASLVRSLLPPGATTGVAR
ncbi:MAG TPA: ATP synthase subunit I [Acidimicrobiales bacterium]|nr:ATP synthase subunit I [Acidimicrobiales bacterium]